MANIYMLGAEAGGFRLAIHINIPATTNAAGIAWSDAIKRSGLYKGTSIMPTSASMGATEDTGGTIGATEAAALAAFTRVEEVRTWVPDSAFAAANGAAKAAEIDAFYALVQSEVQTLIQSKLNFYGLTR